MQKAHDGVHASGGLEDVATAAVIAGEDAALRFGWLIACVDADTTVAFNAYEQWQPFAELVTPVDYDRVATGRDGNLLMIQKITFITKLHVTLSTFTHTQEGYTLLIIIYINKVRELR